jgi:hypothetical protein
MVSSLARANRCFCRREDIVRNEVKEKLNKIESTFEENKNLVEALERIEIVLPKEKNL